MLIGKSLNQMVDVQVFHVCLPNGTIPDHYLLPFGRKHVTWKLRFSTIWFNDKLSIASVPSTSCFLHLLVPRWNDTMHSYLDDTVYPPKQAVIVRCEDFLFSHLALVFHMVHFHASRNFREFKQQHVRAIVVRDCRIPMPRLPDHHAAAAKAWGFDAQGAQRRSIWAADGKGQRA